MPYAFKSIYYIYSIPYLTTCLERGGGGGISMTYGVTLLHKKEAYLHQWFYDVWVSLSSQPFFTFVAIAIMSFPVYILIGTDVRSWSCKYTFYSDSGSELDRHVQNKKKGWIPTYYKPFAVTDCALYIFYTLYLAWWWL